MTLAKNVSNPSPGGVKKRRRQRNLNLSNNYGLGIVTKRATLELYFAAACNNQDDTKHLNEEFLTNKAVILPLMIADEFCLLLLLPKRGENCGQTSQLWGGREARAVGVVIARIRSWYKYYKHLLRWI